MKCLNCPNLNWSNVPKDAFKNLPEIREVCCMDEARAFIDGSVFDGELTKTSTIRGHEIKDRWVDEFLEQKPGPTPLMKTRVREDRPAGNRRERRREMALRRKDKR